jgi:hypothetical protein
MNLFKMSFLFQFVFFFLIGTLVGEIIRIYYLNIIDLYHIKFSIFNSLLALFYIYFSIKTKV